MTTPINSTPAMALGSRIGVMLGLTSGTSLFFVALPDDPTPAVAFLDYPAGQSTLTQNPAADHREGGVQIIVRAADYQSAYSLVDQIRSLCRAGVGFTTSGQSVSGSGLILAYGPASPQGEPIPLGYDERGRYQYSLNVVIGRCVQP